MTDYTVDAELRLRTAASSAGLKQLSGQLQGLTSALRGGQGAGEGMFSSLLKFNVLSSVVSGVARGFSSLIGFSTRYQTDLEATRIGLSAVMGAVEGIDFARAGKLAGQVFDQLKDDALTSTATTSEMFQIYKSIYGPIRAAGAAMETVREITNSTVAASGALGVDMAQASRDISLMARGSAGMHVKLFSMLRSTGAIAESASEFNDLSAAVRVEKLRSALAKFAPAAEAYGNSFAGVTSTFQDIAESFSGAAFGPVFERIRKTLKQVNDYLLAHRTEITRQLHDMGERLGRVLDKVIVKAKAAFLYVSTHWDEVVTKIGDVVEKVRRVVPQLLQAAKAWSAISIARSVLASATGTGAQLAGGAATIGRLMQGAAPAMAGAAGVAGGAAIPEAGVGAGTTAVATAMEGLSVIAVPLAIALAAVASAGLVVYENWQEFLDLFGWLSPVLDAIWNDLTDIFTNLWALIRPIMQIAGMGILTPLIVGFLAFVALLRVVTVVLRAMTAVFLLFKAVVQPVVDYILATGFDIFQHLARWIGMLGTGQGAEATRGARHHLSNVTDILPGLEADMLTYGRQDWQRRPDALAGAHRARTEVHNDFRGSRITVNQEFREADPDRVAIQMIEDLARFAEQRTGSGFVPALTR